MPEIKNKQAKNKLGLAHKDPLDFKKIIEGVIKHVKSVMTKIV
jgi:hypothetical protein